MGDDLSDGVSGRLEAIWRQGTDHAAYHKTDSTYTVRTLSRFIQDLGLGDRKTAEDVLATWVGSGDTKKRFDAIVLIDEFVIVSALPRLRALAASLETSTEPSAAYDWAWINRIIGKLAAEIPR